MSEVVSKPPRPAPLGRATFVLLAAFGSSVFLVRWLDAGLDRAYRGRIDAHRRPIVATEPGRIVELHVGTGDEVRTGSPFARIEERGRLDRLDEVRDREQSLRDDLKQARARVDVELGWRRYEVDRAIFETELKSADLLRQRFDERLRNLTWGELAEADGVVTPVAVEQSLEHRYGHLEALLRNERSRNALEVVEAQRDLCEQRIAALRALRERLPAEVAAAHGVEDIAAELAAAESEARALEDEAGARVLEAPGWGRLDEVEVVDGDPIVRGDVLAVVVDRARLHVAVPVPSRSLDRFPAETPVTLEFPGGERRKGVVLEAAPEPVVRRTEADDPTAESWFLIRVAPTGKLWPEVPLGTTIDVRPAAG